MNSVNQMEKPKGLAGKFAKFAVRAGIALVVVYFVAGLVWRFSGSNQWEFKEEKNGVKVYTLKAPGLDSHQVKGIVRLRSTLAGLVKFMQDPSVCDEVGCYESRMFEREDDQVQYYTFRYDVPLVFKTREFVVKAQFHQDPRTKIVTLQFDAAPEKLPPNKCCFRITDMNNVWRFKPLGDGMVEIEYVMNMNEGGYIPYILLNTGGPQVMTGLLPELEKMVGKEKYQSAKFDFITEK